MLHLTERVFHLLLQDSELPVKVDAAMGLQFLVKFQELCECDGRGREALGRCSWWRGGECGLGGGRCGGGGRDGSVEWKSGDNVRAGWYNSRRGRLSAKGRFV